MRTQTNVFWYKFYFFSISVDETMKAVHEWMKSTVTDIEAEDGKLIARVIQFIFKVKWEVKVDNFVYHFA